MKKKRKEIKARHYVVVRVARFLLTPIIKIKYRYSYNRYPELKHNRPIMVIGNHTIPIDPILMGLSMPFHLYYFATEQIFNLGLLSKLLVWAVNPIKKAKSVADLSAVRKSKQIVNEGGSIGIYPEGNVSYDGAKTTINPSIVKLIKFLKIPLVFFMTEGLFFSNPRWSIYPKKGKSHSAVTEILEPETYLEFTDDELLDYIEERFNRNAYEQNTENILYKGKDIALGLERLLFVDLKTNQPFVTYSENDKLKSHKSDFELTYQEDGYVKTNDGKLLTLIELNQQTKQAYWDYYWSSPNNFLISETVKLENTMTTRKVKLGKAEVSLFKDKIVFNIKKETINLSFDDVISVSIQGKKKVILYTREQTYLVILDQKSSPYKYLLTYQYYKAKENKEEWNNAIYQFGL